MFLQEQAPECPVGGQVYRFLLFIQARYLEVPTGHLRVGMGSANKDKTKEQNKQKTKKKGERK
ncbi:MAG: hypothetical protein SWQ30_19980 [Thermodesulfobacteriota bacterium]|nr:hypothetical protein [Thermodesulfobacteriota bacterium]